MILGAMMVQIYIIAVTQEITALTQKENPLGSSDFVITFAEFQLVINTTT